MFLLVSVRHVGAHPDGHQHGVSIQISVNLDVTLLRIARELKTAETWFLARLFILQSSMISQILEFIYRTVTIFSFDHMTDENQEFIWLPYLLSITFAGNFTKVCWISSASCLCLSSCWFKLGPVMSSRILFQVRVLTPFPNVSSSARRNFQLVFLIHRRKSSLDLSFDVLNRFLYCLWTLKGVENFRSWPCS